MVAAGGSESTSRPVAARLTPSWALLVGGLLLALAGLLLVRTVDHDPGRRCDGWGLPQLALSGTADRAGEIRSCWGTAAEPGGRPDAGFVADARTALRWDWAFVAAYGAALAFWCWYGAIRARRRPTRNLGAALAVSALLAAAYDAIENGLLWHGFLDDRLPARATVDLTYAVALARWVLVVPAVAFALCAMAATVSRVGRGLLSSTAWPGFLGPEPDLPRPPPLPSPVGWEDRFAVPERGPDEDDSDGSGDGERGDLGICFSGGGIRAASFALGALQALDEKGLYRQARFLATVSGGGYLGGASQFVSQGNERFGTAAVGGPFAGPADPGGPATPEVGFLRQRARFLWSPALPGQRWRSTQMFASALAAALLGIAFNLALLVTLVFVVARPVGWGVRILFTDPDQGVVNQTVPGAWWTLLTLAPLIAAVGAFLWRWLGRIHLVPPARVAVFAGALAGATLVPGFVGRYAVGPESWWDGGRTVLTIAVLLAAPFVLAVLARPAQPAEPADRGLMARILPAAGWVLAEAVAVLFFVWLDEAAAEGFRGDVSWRPVLVAGGIVGGLGLFVVVAAALRLGASILLGSPTPRARLIAIVATSLAVAGVTTYVVNGALWDDAGARLADDWAVWAAVVGLVGLVYVTLDQKRWSPHPLYKARLAGTFSPIRLGERPGEPSDAQALPYGIRTNLSGWGQRVAGSPQLLVCAAAYDTRSLHDPDDTLCAFQFTFSHDYIGGADVGWMRTIDFEAALGRSNASDGTLLAAMAMSGAAVSSAIGQVNLGSLSAAIAVVNARLGVWLPNPRYVNELWEVEADRSRRRVTLGPRRWGSAEGPAVRWLRLRRFTYLLKEIAGVHDLDDRFVYVTDGGQVDNLGLLELLGRRCSRIVAVDASGDAPLTTGTFDEVRRLAWRRYRIRFSLRRDDGSELVDPPDGADDIEPKKLTPDLCTTDPEAGPLAGRMVKDSVVALTIHYPPIPGRGAELGTLVLAKAALTRDAPDPVKEFAVNRGRKFPKDSTADQFIDDDQFESYRLLGRQVVAVAADRLASSPPTEPAPPAGPAVRTGTEAARP
jgi:hypothetical protein